MGIAEFCMKLMSDTRRRDSRKFATAPRNFVSFYGLWGPRILTCKGNTYLQILTVISTVDDLNYPEKTDTYYIVNAPYVFTACWKVISQARLY